MISISLTIAITETQINFKEVDQTRIIITSTTFTIMTSMISHDQVGHWPDEAFEFFLRRQIDFKYVEDLASDI